MSSVYDCPVEPYDSGLEPYVRASYFFNDLVIGDPAISIWDLEKCIFHRPGKNFNLKTTEGIDYMKDGMAIHQAIQEKRRVVRRMNLAQYTCPYIVIALPVCSSDGKVIGGVTVTQSTELQDGMKGMAVGLRDNINGLASNTEEISAQTQEIAAVCRSVLQAAKDSLDRTKNTDEILNFIKSIAGQTNLLGLNAAIESARVGEQGRGFSVVAEEIRKLAANSLKSLDQINAILKTIQTDGQNTYQQIGRVETVVNEIAQASSDVAESVQKASEMAINLDALADKLSSD